jgi:Nucleotide-diphospho-sugar transferase
MTVPRVLSCPGTGSQHRLMFTHTLAAALALYLGILYSFHHHESLCHGREATPAAIMMLIQSSRSSASQAAQRANSTNAHAARKPKAEETHVPVTLAKLLVGAATTDLNDFVRALPLGAPLNGNKGVATDRSKGVLLLYLSAAALPDPAGEQRRTNSSGGAIWQGAPLEEATRNCRQIKHALTSTQSFMRSDRSCVVLVGRGRSAEEFHVQKWKRPNSAVAGQAAAKKSSAWNLAGRYEYIDDRSFNAGMRIVPRTKTQALSRMELQSYLGAFDSALDALRPLAESVARAGTDKVQGTVIVLVTNYGHSVLLRNYVCAARAVGMDTDKILVVATDRPTLELGRSLGVATFYHEQLFAGIPEAASKIYGDTQYSKIMMSKAYCVHLVSQLGYNILFQDVDIVPYQPNLLEWWIDVAKSGYDLYFQFDFSTRPNYAPWYGYLWLCWLMHWELSTCLTSFVRRISGWPTRDPTLRPATSRQSTSSRRWCGRLTLSLTTARTRPPCTRSSTSCRASTGCGSRRSSKITRKFPVRAHVVPPCCE